LFKPGEYDRPRRDLRVSHAGARLGKPDDKIPYDVFALGGGGANDPEEKSDYSTLPPADRRWRDVEEGGAARQD
jgi:hypothetical protein